MNRHGEKGFLFTISIFLILILLLTFLQSFAERQHTYQATLSREMASYKTSHIWEDVREDIDDLWGLNVTRVDGSIIIGDIIPSDVDPGELLAGYGNFVENYYETDDVSITFLDPSGNEMNLSDLQSKLRIEPQGFEYGYPNFGKNALQLTSPVENVTALSLISLVFTFNNDTLNGTSWNPAPKDCAGRVCLPFYIKVDGQVIRDAMTPVDPKSTLNVDCTIGGPSCISIIIGETSPQGEIQNVYDVRLLSQKLANVEVETSLLLNTTEFSVNYMSKLRTKDVNFDIKREDWMES
jgi:hypothetical protein